MLNIRPFSILIILSLFSSFIHAQQVVHIEDKRADQDSEGFSGNTEIGYDVTISETELYQLENSLQLQYLSGSNLYLALNSIKLVRVNGDRIVSNNYQHLRYNRKLTDLVTWEVFTQRQVDNIYRLDLRFLAGSGPRFGILDRDSVKIYFGTLYMYEYENIMDEEEPEINHRSSSYLSLGFRINEQLAINMIGYFQPRFDLISDHRVSGELSINLKVFNNLSISLVNSIRYDSSPPEGITNTFFSSESRLGYRF